MKNEEQNLNEAQTGNSIKADVSGSCYVCGKNFEASENRVDMYGEEVCQQCADDEMYNMLQNYGGG